MDKQNLLISEHIHAELKPLARLIVREQYEQNLELWDRYGDLGFDKCVQDTESHLAYLAEAVVAASLPLFLDYVRWAGTLLEAFNVPRSDFAANLEATRVVLAGKLHADEVLIVGEYLQAGINDLLGGTIRQQSYLEPAAPYSDLAAAYLDALLNGDAPTASSLILDAVAGGAPVRAVYLHVFQVTQRELGRLWQTNQISVAHEHFCTAVTQRIMAQLSVQRDGTAQQHSIIAACISGELHEMGMRMVADFFEMDGWNTYYVGANTPMRSLLKLAADHKPDILALSVTITSHLKALREVIDAVRARDDLHHIKIIVGGYPFNVSPNLWRDMGADGYAQNSDQALQIAAELVQRPAR